MTIIPLLQALSQDRNPTSASFLQILHQFPSKTGYFKKSEILAGFKQYAGQSGINNPGQALIKLLLVKPVRTMSGVTPVTVLTKPYPCPGNCIFCPSDIKMPKSYLSNEPGAQRAANNCFDPYLQTYNRLRAFKHMGHPFDKVELLVLGGTWSVYPLTYRIWFIKRLFEALNDFGDGLELAITEAAGPSIKPKLVTHYNQALSQLPKVNIVSQTESATWAELIKEQARNEHNQVRNVGLVLETRPDYVTIPEVLNLRKLGATKIQLGVQTLQEEVLKKNERGHTATQSGEAITLLRQAGFKIHIHWMPNLYGSNPAKDKADYRLLFSNPSFKPDEIKIYPCSLIEATKLEEIFKAGNWQPYTHAELLDVVSYCLVHTPRYCRITRVVRDIPSNSIVTGNKYTNFRQMAEAFVTDSGQIVKDIRAREVKNVNIDTKILKCKETVYDTVVSNEVFLEYVTPTDKLAGFLRLSLPNTRHNKLTDELNDAAIIREVHIYGQALAIGSKKLGIAQHAGLGKKLIKNAIAISKKAGFNRVSVISAIGTREYYEKLGFKKGDLYHHYEL